MRLLPGFGCEVGAKSSSLAAAIRVAERTGRCEIRPNSYVHKIELDANGRATGALYFDEKRNTHLQKAKAVVVCANGAETPRLLLLSANKQFPDGLANSSGLVGKNLMFNSGGTVTGVYEHPLNDYKGYCVSRVLHDFYELDHEKVGFYGGGGLDARYDFTPITFAFGGVPPETPRWGQDAKTSVINADHRTHDVKNLFLCDGSSLVTSGRGQPTMTIMALAFRAADRIIALAKRGEISA